MGDRIILKKEVKTPLLRKLQQPLYDTNTLDATVATNLMSYFVRPQGNLMPVAAVVKTEADTNMKATSMLGEPLIFDLLGFNYEWFKSVPTSEVAGTLLDIAADEIRVYGQSVFRFYFNMRIFLEVPLRQIPEGPYLNGSVCTGDAKLCPGTIIGFH